MKVTRTHRYKKGAGNTMPCDHCRAPSVGYVDYAVSWFRGDDERYFLCKDALDMVRAGRENELGEIIAGRRRS